MSQRKKHHDFVEIMKSLSSHERGESVKNICKRLNISMVTFYKWKKRYSINPRETFNKKREDSKLDLEKLKDQFESSSFIIKEESPKHYNLKKYLIEKYEREIKINDIPLRKRIYVRKGSVSKFVIDLTVMNFEDLKISTNITLGLRYTGLIHDPLLGDIDNLSYIKYWLIPSLNKDEVVIWNIQNETKNEEYIIKQEVEKYGFTILFLYASDEDVFFNPLEHLFQIIERVYKKMTLTIEIVKNICNETINWLNVLERQEMVLKNFV